MIVEIKSLSDVLTLLNKHRKSRLQKPRRDTKPLPHKICPHQPSSLERKLNFPPPLADRAEHPQKKRSHFLAWLNFHRLANFPRDRTQDDEYFRSRRRRPSHYLAFSMPDGSCNNNGSSTVVIGLIFFC